MHNYYIKKINADIKGSLSWSYFEVFNVNRERRWKNIRVGDMDEEALVDNRQRMALSSTSDGNNRPEGECMSLSWCPVFIEASAPARQTEGIIATRQPPSHTHYQSSLLRACEGERADVCVDAT